MTHVNFFRSQRGGGDIPLFHGLGGTKSGQLFGDFFRGMLLRVIPIARNGGKSALPGMRDAQDSGESRTYIVKAAIRQSAPAAIGGTIAQIEKAQQVGGRKHKKRESKSRYKEMGAMSSKLIS